jgi:hypothetical protein
MRRSLILLAVCVAACGGSTEPAVFTLNGSFTLDSVDTHHLPVFSYVSQGDSIFTTSTVVTINPATKRFALESRDSTLFASGRSFVGAFNMDGPMLISGDATFDGSKHVGPDSVWFSGIGSGPGRILGPAAFTQSSGSSTMYFSKH